MIDNRRDDDPNDEASSSYNFHAHDVGYGKPPVQGRFKPGQSGNPSGKRRSSGNFTGPITQKRLHELFLEDAHRPFPIRDGDKSKNELFVKVLIRSLGLHAVKGSVAAQKQYLAAYAAAVGAVPSEQKNMEVYDLSNLTEREAVQLMELLLKAKPKAV
jgi:hypothetical protein